MAATATQLLSLSWSAVRRRLWLLVPLVVAETLLTLTGLLPTFVVFGRAWVIAKGEPLLLGLGLLQAITERQTLLTAGYAFLFATIVAWLVRGLLLAGALGTLYQAVGNRLPEDDSTFSRAILVAPERWIASSAVVTLLRAFTLLCIVGGVIAAMSFFVAKPGVLAAAAMTFACAMVVTGPLLAVALELAFARAVLLGEGPLDSVSRALIHAFRRRDALIPAWAGLLLVEIGLSFVAAIGSTALQGPPNASMQVLFMGPQMAWTIVVFALVLAVMLVRQGLYAVLVREASGTLVVPPRRRPVVARPVRVFEARPVPPANEHA